MRVVRQVRSALVFAWINGLLPIWRTPLWVVSYLMFPLSFLFLIHVYIGEVSSFAILGGFVMMFAFNGVGVLGEVVYYKAILRFQDMVVASPTSSLAYMLGHALSSLIFSLPGLVVLTVVAMYFNVLPSTNIFLLALALILIWASLASLGFAISTVIKEPRHAWPAVAILSVIISVLPPVFYPVTILPKAYAPISLLIPSGSGAVIIHSLASLINISQDFLTLAWSILILETVLLLVFVKYRARWRET